VRPDDRQTRAQEAQYAFPYHYLPALTGRKFSSTRHWDWGFRYLGGMELAIDLLRTEPFASLIDIGCGDGRFLREIASRFSGSRLLGVDASERAVRLAQALNPDLEYRSLDIVRDAVAERFAVATLIEVIEHIPPAELPAFLHAVIETLAEGGKLVLTVPHRNKPQIEKHYQHFTGSELRALLAPYLDDIRLFPFDPAARSAPLMWLIERILGAKGKWFLFTNTRVLYLLYRLYIRRYLYASDESCCERIALVGRKKPVGR
jgi:SAM-dependent methyltransferase